MYQATTMGQPYGFSLVATLFVMCLCVTMKYVFVLYCSVYI